MPTKRKASADKSTKPASRKRDDDKLTPLQEAFISELLADENMNATAAYLRVAKCSQKAAEVSASRLLSQDKIKKGLIAARERLQQASGVTAVKVLQQWWQIATADPNDIMQLRRECCRHCHGIDHAFQWRDEREFEQALAKAQADADAEEKEANLPTNEGGYGFSKGEPPHPDCPECDGNGHGRVHITDTRHLTGSARRLYAGIKQTQHGIEVKTRDQDAALQNIARHLGMFNDKLQLQGDKENPLFSLIADLKAGTLKPVTDDEGDD
jgi:phage terminase small subunit